VSCWTNWSSRDYWKSSMTRFIHNWQIWRFLSQQERAQWLQAWLLMPFVALGLRLFSLRRVQAMLYRNIGGNPCREDLPAAKAVVHLFHSAVRWSLLPTSCLARSLVLCWLLRNQSLEADLRIGVAILDGHFTAHAWVVHWGMALEDEEVNSHFVAFDRLPTSSQRWQI
jgi:hypothetical protein